MQFNHLRELTDGMNYCSHCVVEAVGRSSLVFWLVPLGVVVRWTFVVVCVHGARADTVTRRSQMETQRYDRRFGRLCVSEAPKLLKRRSGRQLDNLLPLLLLRTTY